MDNDLEIFYQNFRYLRRSKNLTKNNSPSCRGEHCSSVVLPAISALFADDTLVAPTLFCPYGVER